MACNRGYSSIRHNDIRDLTARLLTEVCPNVAIEPDLQPLSGETLSLRTSNSEDGAHLDVSAQGFWGDRHERAFFDVRVFNPLAPSNCRSSLSTTYRRHEATKKQEFEKSSTAHSRHLSSPLLEVWRQLLQIPSRDWLHS